jgi:hypothetical protein
MNVDITTDVYCRRLLRIQAWPLWVMMGLVCFMFAVNAFFIFTCPFPSVSLSSCSENWAYGIAEFALRNISVVTLYLLAWIIGLLVNLIYDTWNIKKLLKQLQHQHVSG